MKTLGRRGLRPLWMKKNYQRGLLILPKRTLSYALLSYQIFTLIFICLKTVLLLVICKHGYESESNHEWTQSQMLFT